MGTRGRRTSLPIAGALLLIITLHLLVNGTTQAEIQKILSPGDIRINEVAWMGTEGITPSDEWIELWNNTARSVALQGWQLYTADGGMLLSLEGNIPAHGYYLIERTDDQTVQDIPADLVASFGGGLHNSGERLILEDSTGQRIDSANLAGGTWPAGTAAPDYRTMERIRPGGEDMPSNWGTNDGVTRNGTSAHGNPINGTPKAPNSQSLPNLSLHKAGPLTATSGSLLTYTLALENSGGTTATGVLLTDTLPAGASFHSQESAYPYSEIGQHIRWEIGDLAPQAQSHLTLTAITTKELPASIVNNAESSTTSSESKMSDNHASWETVVSTSGSALPPVLINALLYDGIQAGDADEAIQLFNTRDITTTLVGWKLCKYAVPLDCTPLPPLTFPGTSDLWLARNTHAFTTTFGFLPHNTLESWPYFSNEGDEVILRDANDKVIDTLVYKAGTASIQGWLGPGVEPYDAGQALEGQILTRIPNEINGHPLTDTNRAEDWLQHPAGMGQVRYPGWDLDPLFWPLTATEPATLIAGIAPDNAYDVISATLLRAQETISIEVYTLRHPIMVELLTKKAQSGVKVTILLEGDQVGISPEDPRWQEELWACQQIEQAGGQCYFMIQARDDGIQSRYHYLHAKLVIIDNQWVVIGSQNLTETSLPSDDKGNGTYGSRGAILATDAPMIVNRAVQIFSLDCDPQHHRDILRWNTAYTEKYGPPAIQPPITVTDATSTTLRFPAPLVLSGTFQFTLLTAPEAALRQSDALLGLLNQAGPGDSILVEQLYEYPRWGTLSNPRLEAYIAAARRGADVRILLNNGTFDRDYITPIYTQTLAYVNQIAQDEELSLRAAAGDPTHYGIHNKMVLVTLKDRGAYTHIGSLNGSENASKVNREIAIHVQSSELHAYFARMFELDWQLSNPIRLPLVMKNYTPPRTVLISEVCYAPGSPNQEWVELYNPTGAAIEISQYKIGDAEGPERYEGMFQFPPSTVLEPYSTLVLAYDGREVPRAEIEIYPYRPEIPEMISYPAWGMGDWGLRNAGDQILLLGPDDTTVDAVVWGDASYGALIPHPGVEIATHSLQRYPPSQDTENCAQDFRGFPPSPGELLVR